MLFRVSNSEKRMKVSMRGEKSVSVFNIDWQAYFSRRCIPFEMAAHHFLRRNPNRALVQASRGSPRWMQSAAR